MRTISILFLLLMSQFAAVAQVNPPPTTGGPTTIPVPVSQGGTGATSLAAAGIALASGQGTVYNVLGYGIVAGDVDTGGANSTAMLALLATVNTAGGGTIYFPPGTYRFDSQLLLPNTGGASATQANLRITGAGGGPTWEIGSGLSNMLKTAARLDLRYQGNNNAKIETEGQGTLQIDNLMITDGSTPPSFSVTGATLTNVVVTSNVAVATFVSTLNQGRYIGATWEVSGATGDTDLNGVWDVTAVSGTTITFSTTNVTNGTYNNGALTLTYAAPFIHTTATTLDIHGVAFVGATGQTTQDAIVLGGNTNTYSGTPAQNDPFNGYGTVIAKNSFAYLGRGLYLRTQANGVLFEGNTFVRHGVGLVAVDCDGTNSIDSGGANFGNIINNNLFEGESYVYPIRLNHCQNGNFIGNGFFDFPSLLAYFRMTGTSYYNYIVLGYADPALTIISDDDGGATRGVTTVFGGGDRPGINGYGAHIGADIAYGMNVAGRYDATKLTTGYPGQFTVFDRTVPTGHLSIGVTESSQTYLIDAYDIGTGAQTLQLNPNGGAVQMPNVAGATTTVSGGLKFDTTNKNFHAGANSVDNIVPLVVTSAPLVDGNSVKASVSAGVVRLVDAGASISGTVGATASAIPRASSAGVLADSKLTCTASPVTCTLYDDTATTGLSKLNLRAGASVNSLIEVFTNGNSSSGTINGAGQVSMQRFQLGTSGAFQVDFDATSILLFGSGANIAFSSTGSFSGTKDTSISRVSPGVVGIGTGANGSHAGTLQSATIVIDNSSFTFNGHTCTIVSTVVTCP